MKDEILESAIARLAELDRERAELEDFIKRRRLDNDAVMHLRPRLRFSAYGGRKKAAAIAELVEEHTSKGGLTLEQCAQLMVEQGVPLGGTRQLANAKKSILGLIESGRFRIVNGKLALPASSHSAD
jgi:hypothetical protein